MMRIHQTLILAVLLAASHESWSQNSASLQMATRPGSPGPIPTAWADAFSAIRPDAVPAKLTRNSHYWVSDEERHDLFKEAVADKGGVFIGLGTDQNYLMAGWARPEVLIPLDFDGMIVSLHFAFRVIFLNAATPQQFINLWTEEKAKTTKALIEEAYMDKGPEFCKQVSRAFKIARKRVLRRLLRIEKRYKTLNVSNFLDDQSQYDFVVDLFKSGRVFPVRGDLTADKTMKDVAEAAAKAGLPVRVLYLSNAEQYFKYTKGYRENMLALPFDGQSVVVRTLGTRSQWAADGVYDYAVQSSDNFRAWLNSPATFNVWTLEKVIDVDKKTGRSTITRLPEPTKKKK